MRAAEFRDLLTNNGLKVTLQRIAVYEAIIKGPDHPSAEMITRAVQKKYPNISAGTIYKTLDTFVQKGILKRVKTDADVMRYDPVLQRHHHLYSLEDNRIEDYYDEELNSMIEDYFMRKNIPGFSLEDYKLQLMGSFQDKKRK